MFSTLGDPMNTLGGYHEYIEGCSVQRENTMSTSGEYHEYIGRYHEYIGGRSVHQGDIMMQVGSKGDKNLSIYIEHPNVLNIPNVLMISPDVMNTPDVLMISP